ncbi:MAG TPA: transporter substrate-binding domain-containing protein [Burkholderiales bacterium]|jgi:polar amino acid transport system substrate-binding protein|nr:transporter substrate-binding domain-containing protein [Burkholderiales bacterium]
MNKDLAPSGKLRIGINYSNFLIVSGDGPDGEPRGIAPDLGRELARKAGLPFEFVRFDAAGKLFDAVKAAQCDVGFLGAEPQRAAEVEFTQAYLELPVTFLVPLGSPIKSIADIDREGVRVSVSDRSAYDLFLTRTLKKAKIIRTPGIPASFDTFVREKLDALAGLKPRLVEEQARLSGSRILEGEVTSVQQAMGAPKGRAAAAKYLREFAEEVKRSGFVARAIEKYNVKGVRVAS